MPLEADIIAKVQSDFPSDDAANAIELLAASGKTGRIARCIVIASAGSLALLRDNIRMAIEDPRDVILAAEYEHTNHVRDLSTSFLVDTPEKWWVGSIAKMLRARGYVLSSIESHPAAVGPVECLADSGEGVATFTGNLGPITIEKKNGKWSLKGGPSDRNVRHLSQPHENEEAFVNALSCHLLAKQNPR